MRKSFLSLSLAAFLLSRAGVDEPLYDGGTADQAETIASANVHCNWGQGGTSNGWFSSSAYTYYTGWSTDYNFSSNIRCVYILN